MHQSKRVLLIAGGGTLGTYTAEELLKLGYHVDVLCPEDKTSFHESLCYHKGLGDETTLRTLLSQRRYHGVVNFIHYPCVDDYKPIHALLATHAEHVIFLSSYRVYADEQHPITEDAPLLLDVSTDADFLANEDYALAKARGERFLRHESGTANWTAVRPVISFSQYRLDIVTINQHTVLEKARAGEPLYLPEAARHLTAGLDWAGNSGKLIAHLLFKPHAFGQSYTVSSAPNLTWEQVAALYTELIGVTFRWVSTEAFIEAGGTPYGMWALYYDRLFDRTIDNRKVLAATGLTNADFKTIKEGLKIELDKLGVTYRNG